MSFDFATEIAKASTNLALCLMDARPLSNVFDEAHPKYVLEDQNDPESVVVSYDILYTIVHHLQKEGMYGPYAEIVLSADKKRLSVLLNEFQPWGHGNEESICVGEYPISEINEAIVVACKYMNAGFELTKLVENEATGNYNAMSNSLPVLG